MGSGREFAAPLPQEAPPPTDQPPTDQPMGDEPFAEILPPVEPDEPGAALIPTLPAAVILELAQPIVAVGEQVRLTIVVNCDITEDEWHGYEPG